MIIFGCDPGKTNFAWSVIEVEDLTHNYLHTDYLEAPKVLASGFFEGANRFCQETVIQRKLLKEVVTSFLDLVSKHKAEYYVYERFMPRPGQALQGWQEKLQYTLGGILAHIDIPTYAIMASAWKTKFLCRYKITSTKSYFGGALKSEHEADASLIALYAYHTWFKQEEK